MYIPRAGRTRYLLGLFHDTIHEGLLQNADLSEKKAIISFSALTVDNVVFVLFLSFVCFLLIKFSENGEITRFPQISPIIIQIRWYGLVWLKLKGREILC